MNNLQAFTPPYYGVVLFIKSLAGALAVFFAILVWHKTRKGYMVLFVFGVLSSYILTLVQSMNYFGFIMMYSFNIKNIPVGAVFFEIVPIIFFTASLCLFLKSDDF
ncbi:hypothetical protein [Treponema pedis]|uniref:hypothetical protein n=1 Tax=Treponema pedis TaxID=409322 RepID=UPI003143C596